MLAQKVFEQGHYAGRTQPTNTRQGTYATAPSGVMLASVNTNNPQAMAEMLRKALDRWNAMPEAERMLGDDPALRTAEVKRPESRYPSDGLVLRFFSRDLPRPDEPKAKDWRAEAWNQDYAWFTKEEARSLTPSKLAEGETHQVQDRLIRRLAKLSFVDNVRGQTGPLSDEHVQLANLVVDVQSVSGGVATLRFRGATRTERVGNWAIAGFKDMNSPSEQRLTMNLKLYGTGRFDVAKERFETLELVALGTRYGATQYNGRHDDLGPAPIGYFATKAGNTAAERVAPAFYWAYGR